MSSYVLSLIVRHSLNITALTFLLHLLGQNVMMTKRRVCAYRTAIILTIAVMFFECAGVILDGAGAAWWTVNFAANIAGFSCSAFIPYVLALSCQDENSPKNNILFIFPVCMTLLCLLSSVTGWVFTVSHQNVYSRGPAFSTYIITYFIGTLFMIVSNYNMAIHLARRERLYLLGIFAFFLVGVSVQVFRPDTYTSWQCITLCLLLYYIFQREIQFRYDPLTGVLNRAAFEKEMESTSSEIKIIVILDVDHFKSINDSHGHIEGDHILSIAGSLLLKCFSKCGNCYRIGGDEFAILCTAGESVFHDSIHKMICKVELERAHTPWFPNISYGYHMLQSGESLFAAFQKADEQMYHYKHR